MKRRGPKPQVEFDGVLYSLRSYKTAIRAHPLPYKPKDKVILTEEEWAGLQCPAPPAAPAPEGENLPVGVMVVGNMFFGALIAAVIAVALPIGVGLLMLAITTFIVMRGTPAVSPAIVYAISTAAVFGALKYIYGPTASILSEIWK